MVITNAVLVVASKSIKVEHELLADIKLNLVAAISLSKAYIEIENSIFWNDASSSTKQRINQKLNHLAFDIKSSILDALKAMNQYCDLMGEQPCPAWFASMSYDIQDALRVLNKEHSKEVDAIQLQLIKFE